MPRARYQNHATTPGISGVEDGPEIYTGIDGLKIGQIECENGATALYRCVLGKNAYVERLTGQSHRKSMLEFRFPILIAKDAMLDNEFLNSLSRQLSALIPMAADLRADFRTKIERQLHASFASLDLLSRSEFDAQTQALQGAQERVQELEQLLATMDARLTELEDKPPK